MTSAITLEERARRPWLYNNPTTRDFAFELCTPASARRAQLDNARARVVEAYAVRWNTPTEGRTGDGMPCWQIFRRDAFDEWLATAMVVGTPVLVNHGQRLDSSERSAVLAEPVGELLLAVADDYGLRTWSLFHETPLGDQVLAAIRRGALRAFSVHAPIGDSRHTGEFIGGEPVYELRKAGLRELGPTHEPADAGALILSIGGEPVEHRAAYDVEDLQDLPLEDFLDAFARVLGMPSLAEHAAGESVRAAEVFADLADVNATRAEQLLFEDRMEREHTRPEAADEWKRRLERIIGVLKEERGRALSDYGWWRSRSFRDSRDASAYRESRAHADRVEADLLAHLDGDRTALRIVLGEYDVPHLPSDLDRIRDLARFR